MLDESEEFMFLNCGVGEGSWKSLGLQGHQANQSWRKSILNIHWKDWCWSWNCNTLATWYEELTCWKTPWCWERLKAGGEGDNRGWDGWTASPTWWKWVWVSSWSWWWTGRPGMLQSMGSQRIRHNWATELNWWKKPSQHCKAIFLQIKIYKKNYLYLTFFNYFPLVGAKLRISRWNKWKLLITMRPNENLNIIFWWESFPTLNLD